MIDVESKIFTPIAETLRTSFPNISVEGEYVLTPAEFPHVTIVEADNYIDYQYLDSADTERYNTLTYEVNVYTNKPVGKKSQAKAIMKMIDDKMYSMNFIRMALTAVPNMENASIYRLVARYGAVTDGENIYRR